MIDEEVIAAAKRIGLANVELGPELMEELKSDTWGSTYEFRIRNVLDHLGRHLLREPLLSGGQVQFDAFMGFDEDAVALWDLVATRARNDQVSVDLLAITPM